MCAFYLSGGNLVGGFKVYQIVEYERKKFF